MKNGEISDSTHSLEINEIYEDQCDNDQPCHFALEMDYTDSKGV